MNEFDEAWFAITSYNTETQYGWGTLCNSEKYADFLGDEEKGRYYHVHSLHDEEVIELEIEKMGIGFNLEDELDEIERCHSEAAS